MSFSLPLKMLYRHLPQFTPQNTPHLILPQGLSTYCNLFLSVISQVFFKLNFSFLKSSLMSPAYKQLPTALSMCFPPCYSLRLHSVQFFKQHLSYLAIIYYFACLFLCLPARLNNISHYILPLPKQEMFKLCVMNIASKSLKKIIPHKEGSQKYSYCRKCTKDSNL